MATRDDSSTYRDNCAWCGRRTEVGPVVEEDQDGKQIVSDVCFDCFPDDQHDAGDQAAAANLDQGQVPADIVDELERAQAVRDAFYAHFPKQQ
ncbi:hypothetical protein [Streptomyces sp. NPDC058672]|uniref:hypothetical protein n=1 Tax=Streptomyces sp. NPDC058672 TaxID=3346591 RepID=UPI00365CAB7E